VATGIRTFYTFWKEVKGQRAKVYVNDPDIQAVAFIDADKAHIVLSNLDTETKSFRLDIAEMLGYHYANIRIEHLYVPPDTGATITATQQALLTEVDGSPQNFGNITLRENEFVKLTVSFDKPVVAKREMKRQTYYSNDYLQPIVANKAINFGFSSIDTTTGDSAYSSALIRLSLGRAHARSKKPVVKVNGTKVMVPDDWAGYDQATRDSFFGSIEIPFDRSLLTANTSVEVVFSDTGGHVSTIVMDVNNVSMP